MPCIDVSNCCCDCPSAELCWEVTNTVRGEHDVTYTIEFTLTCYQVGAETVTVTVTLSCDEIECQEIELATEFCTITVKIGNGEEGCTCEPCDPCPPPCETCVTFVDFPDTACDPLDEDIYPSIITMDPLTACTGEEFTISFRIQNDTGFEWTPCGSPGAEDCYARLDVYLPFGCTCQFDFTYVSGSPTPDRTDGGTVGPCPLFGAEWDFTLSDGAYTDFSITFELDVCSGCTLADTKEIMIDVAVARGCRKPIILECTPCP